MINNQGGCLVQYDRLWHCDRSLAGIDSSRTQRNVAAQQSSRSGSSLSRSVIFVNRTHCECLCPQSQFPYRSTHILQSLLEEFSDLDA